MGGSNAPNSFRALPLKEEMYTPAMTRGSTDVGSSGFDATLLHGQTLLSPQPEAGHH